MKQKLIVAALGTGVCVLALQAPAEAETCRWRGDAPFCDLASRCKGGEIERNRHNNNSVQGPGRGFFGAACRAGTYKVYCCTPDPQPAPAAQPEAQDLPKATKQTGKEESGAPYKATKQTGKDESVAPYIATKQTGKEEAVTTPAPTAPVPDDATPDGKPDKQGKEKGKEKGKAKHEKGKGDKKDLAKLCKKKPDHPDCAKLALD